MRPQAKATIETCALALLCSASIWQASPAKEPVELPPAASTAPPESPLVDDQVKSLLKRWDIPGCAIAICKDGQVLLARGYGYANLAGGLPINADRSLFRIASLSKPITALAVLKLTEQSELRLSNYAFGVLPQAARLHGPDPRLQQVTVRDLLDMTAGWDTQVSGDPILQPYITRAARYLHVPGPAGFDTTMSYVLSKKLDFAPGTRFAYSNFCYGVLGKIIEQVSGQDYESFVRRSILEPCGVQLYPAHTLQQDRLPNEVVYYAPLEPAVRPLLPCHQRRVSAPYSRAYLETDLPMIGWLASAPQLAQLFDKMLSKQSPLAAKERQEIFRCPPINDWQRKRRFFSMGWEVITDAQGRQYLYKDGTLPGSRTFAEHTASGITWVALFNARPLQQKPDKFARQVQGIMSGALYWLSTTEPSECP